jgi:hypothetical protein
MQVRRLPLLHNSRGIVATAASRFAAVNSSADIHRNKKAIKGIKPIKIFV